MSQPRQPWYDSDDPRQVVRGATLLGMRWYVALLVFAGLIGVAIWGLTVLTASIKGRGDAQIQIESAENRIAAQAQFQERINAIKGLDGKIGIAAVSLADYRKQNAGKPDDAIGSLAKEDARLAAVLSGVKMECVDAVAQYNANAQKINLARFRDLELPAQISVDGNGDPAMDCKENSQ